MAEKASMKKNGNSFDLDLMTKLRDPRFASNYVMSAIAENDIDFLPVALGDIARAHGVSKLAEESGINRRTLYKIFDHDGRPSFDLVAQIIESLGLEIQVRPKKPKRSKVS